MSLHIKQAMVVAPPCLPIADVGPAPPHGKAKPSSMLPAAQVSVTLSDLRSYGLGQNAVENIHMRLTGEAFAHLAAALHCLACQDLPEMKRDSAPTCWTPDQLQQRRHASTSPSPAEQELSLLDACRI